MNILLFNHNACSLTLHTRVFNVLQGRDFAMVMMMVAMIFAFILTTGNRAHANERVYDNRYAAYVIDAETGVVLYQKNADKKLHPASLTKMMTLLMVFDALDRGVLKLHHRVRITEHAASMVPSKLDLPVGSTISVREAILSLVTKSANDVAAALGDKLGNSEENFARLMTRKAHTLGMKDTTFKNASGLHDPEQITTAKDMAKLARILMTTYGTHYHYFSTRSFTHEGKTYKSHNRLLETYPGMDGFKTGYIRASGFNLVSSAKQDNKRLIGVVFGGKTGNLRNAEMERILNYAFDQLKDNTLIASAAAPIPREKPADDLPNIINAKVASGTGISSLPAKVLHISERWSLLHPSPDSSAIINRMSSEGDVDDIARNRVKAGLIAISAHIGDDIPPGYLDGSAFAASATPPVRKVTYNVSKTSGQWGIQIGAFSQREKAQMLLARTLNSLPPEFRHGVGLIAPLQSEGQWLYRGQIKGYTKDTAAKACELLSECIIISPDMAHYNR